MKHRMSFVLVAMAILGLLWVPGVASAQDAKIAVVDMARVIHETNDGKAAVKRLERDMKRRQKTLDDKQKEFEKLASDLQSSFEMLSEDAQKARLQEYQTKAAELQQLYQQQQGELARAESEATSKIINGVVDIVTAIAKKAKYSLVLDAGTVVYQADGVDITDAVIAEYNKKHP